MSTEIVTQQSIQELVESWFKAEREGNQFPVPFDMAWPMAGYSRKDGAKRYGLKGLIAGEHFSVKTWKKPQGGRPGELIELSMAGFEHLCLMADTDEGKAVRDLYRQAKAKWDLVQQVNPEVAQEVEILHLKIELAKQEAIARQAEQKTFELRHYVVTALPKPLADRVLGVTEIKEIEYVPQTITPEGEKLDGVGITYLQKRYGFKSTAATWAWLDSVGCGKESGYWQDELVAVHRPAFPRGILEKLDDLAQFGHRQRWIGE